MTREDGTGEANEPGETEEPGKGGRSAPPSPDRVRLELVLFSELIQTLAAEDRLLDAVPFLLGRLGDIRRVLFEYEVRCTERLLPIEDPAERETRRLLRELEKRHREMIEEWGEGWTPEESDDAAEDD